MKGLKGQSLSRANFIHPSDAEVLASESYFWEALKRRVNEHGEEETKKNGIEEPSWMVKSLGIERERERRTTKRGGTAQISFPWQEQRGKTMRERKCV